MTGIFKQKTPANLIVLLLMGLLIKLPVFLNPHVPSVRMEDGYLYREMIGALKFFPALVFPVIAWMLLFINAVFFTRIINNNRMMSSPNWYPGMAYLLITSLFPEWNFLSPPLLVSSFFLYIIFKLFRTYNQPDAKGAIFNMGLGIGLASFIYFPASVFLIWVLLALMIMRPFRLSEWILCLLGAITPFYFFAAWLFISGQWDVNQLIPGVSTGIPSLQQSVWAAGAVTLLLLPFLFGGYFIQDGLRKMLIQVRKGWSIFLLFILFAFFVPFVNGTGSFENWILVAVPFAAFHACMYLYSSLRVVPLIVFWGTVAFIIAFQYLGPRW